MGPTEEMESGKNGLKILFVVNVEWYFLSHRIALARTLRDKGFSVSVTANSERGQEHRIEAEGIRFIPHNLKRRSLSPLDPLTGIRSFYRLYRKERPDIVHHLTIKPVIYGSIAARLARIPLMINTIPGLGYMFVGSGLAGRFRRSVACTAYRIALHARGAHVIFQNRDDRELLVGLGVVAPEKARVIRGSGVNLREFMPGPEPSGSPVVLLASRLIWDKGVRELVEATRILRGRGLNFRTVLAGIPDESNPNSVPAADLEHWVKEGIIDWWGHRDDISAVINQASVVVLPSYREGVPRILIEASGAGKPIVTTDAPGCREVVRHNENGLLVPLRDSLALAEAIQKLLLDPELRRRMGLRGREIMLREFSEEVVIEETMKVYRESLGERWPQGN